jgi:hypothetical protein
MITAEPNTVSPHAGSWCVYIPESMTVVELAAIMGGIGVRTIAHHEGGGVFVLRPIDAGAPMPTPEQLRDILEHGLPAIPPLVSRPDLRHR